MTERARTTILVADDDDDLREIVTDVLRADGYRVLEACDGHAAVAVAMRERPDVMLLDQRMPGLVGVEVVHALRARGVHLRIVLMTAARDIEELARALALRFYVQKPVSVTELRAVIRQAMACREHIA